MRIPGLHPSTKRYLVRLYVKELVLKNFAGRPVEQVAERMIELSLRRRKAKVLLIAHNSPGRSGSTSARCFHLRFFKTTAEVAEWPRR